VGDPWAAEQEGILVLPSGRLVRGRGLRTLYLLGREPDFRLPSDPAAAGEAFLQAWARAAGERVEVACGGGRGRTGTALACLAVIEGVAPGGAVDYVRRHYDRRAVETPWQRRYVARFRSRGG
jgi:hypothetical protein